jgi:zinc protease
VRAVAVVICLALSTAAAAAERYRDEVVERTLPNGFKMILLEDHKSPVAVAQVWYRVGSRNEIPGVTGLSHMLEHMMFKGTEKYPEGTYSEIISQNGGEENAFTTDDATMYYARLASDRLPTAIELEADRMRNLVLTDTQFEPERRVVAEERRLRTEDNPIAFLYETLIAQSFLEHPYRQPTIGWANDIAGWKLSDLKQHYDLYYQPNNAFLVAVGDFDARALGDLAAEKFGGYPRGPDAPPVRAREQPPRGPVRISVERPAELAFVALTYRAPNLHHPDSAALDLLQAVLSGGKSSRLYRRLVHEDRLALDVDASYERTAIDDKTFTISAQPQLGVPIAKLEEAILAELAEIARKAPDADEVARAKARIESAFVFSQDSVFYRGLLLGTYELTGDWRSIDDYLPAMRAVQPEDVRRVAEIYLAPDKLATGVLVPRASGAPAEGVPTAPPAAPRPPSTDDATRSAP